MNPTGLITLDRELNVLAADRFFLDAVGSGVEDPTGQPLDAVLGKARGRDPLKPRITDRKDKCGSVETTRRGRRLRVDYARAKLENDQSAIFLTVEVKAEAKAKAR